MVHAYRKLPLHGAVGLYKAYTLRLHLCTAAHGTVGLHKAYMMTTFTCTAAHGTVDLHKAYTKTTFTCTATNEGPIYCYALLYFLIKINEGFLLFCCSASE
jgi:hypothetical protein